MFFNIADSRCWDYKPRNHRVLKWVQCVRTCAKSEPCQPSDKWYYRCVCASPWIENSSGKCVLPWSWKCRQEATTATVPPTGTTESSTSPQTTPTVETQTSTSPQTTTTDPAQSSTVASTDASTEPSTEASTETSTDASTDTSTA